MSFELDLAQQVEVLTWIRREIQEVMAAQVPDTDRLEYLVSWHHNLEATVKQDLQAALVQTPA